MSKNSAYSPTKTAETIVDRHISNVTLKNAFIRRIKKYIA